MAFFSECATHCRAFTRQSATMCRALRKLHPHDVVAVVHEDDLAGDAVREVAHQIDASSGDFFLAKGPFERGAVVNVVDHLGQALDPTRGDGVDRTRADDVYYDPSTA